MSHYPDSVPIKILSNTSNMFLLILILWHYNDDLSNVVIWWHGGIGVA